MSNTRFTNALQGKNLACPPIWFMRQAGRYHDHYQNLRQKYSFMQLCKEPELAAQVAMGPIEDFDFDVAILFSDILFPLEALGFGLEYTEQGPRLGFQLNAANLKSLKPWTDALPHMQFQRQAVQLTREALDPSKSLIGFVGGPWTLFSYAVEGHHSGGLIETKKQISLSSQFYASLVPLLTKNIELQLEAGAEVVMIFDTAAGELSPSLFNEYVMPPLMKLIKSFPGRVGYYSKATHPAHLKYLNSSLGADASTGLAGLGYDHHWDLAQVLKQKSHGFVQGNFDQALLHLSKDEFCKVLKDYLKNFTELDASERKNWICGLGHGVLPKTPMENVKLFVEIVRRTFA